MTTVDTDREAVRIGREILEAAPPETGGIFNREWWYGQIMDWAMRDETFKVQMFRFVDVLPTLRNDREVARHVEEYFAGLELPAVLQLGVKAAGGGITGALAARAIRSNVMGMARRFIAGTDARDALAVLRRLREQRIGFTLDLLGEACVSEAEADEYQRRYLDLVETLAVEAGNWKPVLQIDSATHGTEPRVNVSIKLTALFSQIDPIDPVGSSLGVRKRLRPLFRRARETGAFLNIDMEHYEVKDLTLRIFRELMEEEEFRDFPNAGIVIQAYLTDAEKDLAELIEWARQRPAPITVRLVKGAYWDMETILARQNGWPVPVFVDKEATDASYERCARMLLDAYPGVRTALASHNVRSLAAGIAHARERGLPDGAYEIQALHGMADAIKAALVKTGFRVREYVPIGELIPGMAYLVRRLLENTSNESWLRRKFADAADADALLAPPRGGSGVEPSPGPLKPPAPEAEPEAFRNEPVIQFHLDREREEFAAALGRVRTAPGRTIPVVVNGRPVETSRFIDSVNPAAPGEVIARVHAARTQDADAAVSSARAALDGWRRRPARQRAQILFEAAESMRKRRRELAALAVLEVGKNWRESDADVCEAIDFLEYYGREAIRLGGPVRLLSPPGESNRLVYQGRGVAAVIAPWNFPLAIVTGMTSAALAAGNAVVVKPAEQSPAIAARMAEILWEAGIPRGVLHFLPGHGEEVGAHLVEHPGIDVIAFTGSMEVGLKILETAGRVRPGQRRIKRVITEMGGKNAIVVDSDADLDEAVTGVLKSAFGYQGQKCSACSRVIVVGDAYNDFTRRLVEAVRSLETGPPADPAYTVGPVIDESAVAKVRAYIDQGRAECNVLYEGAAPADGHFVGVTVIGDVMPEHALAQEEIFGPVLAILRARDFETAVEIANGTPYALTGGVFSRSPANIEYARERFEVGNLYLNRGITGALVARQPFGGFSMSGVGSKAGGPDYLLQFMEPRAITENTMRRGFAPPDE
jgi:RHH-type proline utilization regulon transcriptional repressor/proline dehydrogenase/delta 1-pyrroline-5-carboxylate dehydrogenase